MQFLFLMIDRVIQLFHDFYITISLYEKALVQGMELELKVAARVEEIRSEYERQMEE